MSTTNEKHSAASIKQRLADAGFLIDDATADQVARWSDAPDSLVVVEGPAGSGKLTLVETYSQAFGLRLCSHAIGVSTARDWRESDVVVIEDAVRRLSQSGNADARAGELKELIAGRGRGPDGPRPLVVFTTGSGRETEMLALILAAEAPPTRSTMPAPDRERQASIIAHRIPGCPPRLISDCLALAAEIESAGVLGRPLELRDILRLAKAYRAYSASSIDGDNFDTALDVLPKSQSEFGALSAARGRLLEALSYRQARATP